MLETYPFWVTFSSVYKIKEWWKFQPSNIFNHRTESVVCYQRRSHSCAGGRYTLLCDNAGTQSTQSRFDQTNQATATGPWAAASYSLSQLYSLLSDNPLGLDTVVALVSLIVVLYSNAEAILISPLYCKNNLFLLHYFLPYHDHVKENQIISVLTSCQTLINIELWYWP